MFTYTFTQPCPSLRDNATKKQAELGDVKIILKRFYDGKIISAPKIILN